MQSQHATILTGLAAGSACGAALFHYFQLRADRSPPATPVFALQKYLQRFYSEKRHFALSENGGPMVAHMRITPGQQTEFAESAADTCEVAFALSQANTQIAAHATTFYLEPASGRLLGCRANNAHGIFTTGGILPNDAEVGRAGEFFTADMYAGPGEPTPLYKIVSLFELIEDPALSIGQALLRVDTRYEGLTPAATSSIAQTVLYGIDTTGHVHVRRTILYLPERTVSFGPA